MTVGVITYGDHLEDPEGHLVPQPMGCHPALVEVRATLLDSVEQEETLLVGDRWIHFHRGMIAALDMTGRQWVWTVWIDEMGRGVGGQAALL